ncbi:MAG: hypothetical protein ACR2IF_14275 [Terriglobales bacterium]
MASVLITIGVRFLEFLFFAGGIGSLLVLLLTGYEDFLMVLNRKEPEQEEPGSPE